MHNYKHKPGSSLFAFLGGVAIGLVSSGFYFLSPGGRRRRDEMASWIEDAKEDVLYRMKDVKNMTQEKYRQIVDTVVDEYGEARELTSAQMKELSAGLKNRWRQMLETVERSAREAREELDKEK